MNNLLIVLTIALCLAISACASKPAWEYKNCYRYDYYGKQHLTSCKE